MPTGKLSRIIIPDQQRWLDLYPLVWSTDPRIRIRTEMSRIPRLQIRENYVYSVRVLFRDFRQSIQETRNGVFLIALTIEDSDSNLRQMSPSSGCRNQGSKGVSGTRHMTVSKVAYLVLTRWRRCSWPVCRPAGGSPPPSGRSSCWSQSCGGSPSARHCNKKTALYSDS